MEWDFEGLIRTRAMVTEAQGAYARACEGIAAGLIEELAALPGHRIGRASAQMKLALADAVVDQCDVRARQAWHILALRHGVQLPDDADETEVVLRLGRAPSDDDVAALAGLGLMPVRVGGLAFRGRARLAAIAPFLDRYDGYVQDASSIPAGSRSRAPRQEGASGDVDATGPTSAPSPSSSPSTSAPGHDAELSASARFVPRAPFPTRAFERRTHDHPPLSGPHQSDGEDHDRDGHGDPGTDDGEPR